MTTHKSAHCNIDNCKNEATRWFESSQKNNETFYLCETHAEEMTRCNDDYVTFLNEATGKIETRELAVYACDDNCTICHD